MNEPKRCIFFAGTPRTDSLIWDEATLSSEFEARVQRLLDDGKASVNATMMKSTPPASYAKWRSISLDETNSKLCFVHDDIAAYDLQNPKAPTKHANHLDDSDFLEHSIAVLEDLDSSQIMPTMPGPMEEDTTFQTTTTSFSTSLTETSIQTSDLSFNSTTDIITQANQAIPALLGGISDLKTLPTASHILSIKPQTKTVNLIAGVTNVTPPRTVHLKRPRRNITDMEIIELLVGDETRAGFSISFWLVPASTTTSLQKSKSNSGEDHCLRKQLQALRPGMVVLVQNVALDCWRGSVFGQSLSGRRFGGSGTVLTMLDGGKDVFGMQVERKLERVRQWARDFVGVAKRDHGGEAFDGIGRPGKKRKVDELPPDTQD